MSGAYVLTPPRWSAQTRGSNEEELDVSSTHLLCSEHQMNEKVRSQRKSLLLNKASYIS